MWHCWKRCITRTGLWCSGRLAPFHCLCSNRNPNYNSSNQCIISPSAKSERLGAQPQWEIFSNQPSPTKLRQCPRRGGRKEVRAGRWGGLQRNAVWTSCSYYNHCILAAMVIGCTKSSQPKFRCRWARCSPGPTLYESYWQLIVVGKDRTVLLGWCSHWQVSRVPVNGPTPRHIGQLCLGLMGY